MRHPLRFGLKHSGQDTTIESLRTVWRIAEQRLSHEHAPRSEALHYLQSYGATTHNATKHSRPPIWIGASGTTTLRLVARHADVWNIAGGVPDKVREPPAMLDEPCGAVGRDPSEIRRSLQFGWDGEDRDQLIELCGQLLELGVTEQVIYLRGAEPEKLAGKVAAVLPDLRSLSSRGSATITADSAD